MKEGVSKRELVKSLEATLKLTREEIVALELIQDTVIIHFEGGGHIPVNIAMNSGMAIIRDVAKAI